MLTNALQKISQAPLVKLDPPTPPDGSIYDLAREDSRARGDHKETLPLAARSFTLYPFKPVGYRAFL